VNVKLRPPLFDARQNIRHHFRLRLRAEVAFAVQTDGDVSGPAAAGSQPSMTSMGWTFACSASAIFAPARDLSELTGSVPGQFLRWTKLASLVSE
jgi:hypothetical protein